MKLATSVFVAAFVLASTAAYAQNATLQITVRDVRRAQQWQPPSGPFPGTKELPMKAKEGNEIAVVHLDIKATAGIVALHGFGLIDGSGKKCQACEVLVLGWEGTAAPPGGLDVPFEVPKGTQLTKFTLETPKVAIDIPASTPAKK